MTRVLVRGGALAVTALAAACAFGFQRPTVRVAEVRLASLTLTGGRVRVLLAVDNPNGRALEADDFRYALAFAQGEGDDPRWLTLSEGVADAPIRVPPRGTGEVEVALPFEFASVGRALGSLLRRGELEYRFTGELRVRRRLGGTRVPFDERGVFRP